MIRSVNIPTSLVREHAQKLDISLQQMQQACDMVVRTASAQDQGLLEQLSSVGENRFPKGHVFLNLGPGQVALPVMTGLIQTELCERLGLVYYTMGQRNPVGGLIGEALSAYARAAGISCQTIDTNAIVVKAKRGKNDEYEFTKNLLPNEILSTLQTLAGGDLKASGVSLIESIALGRPGLRPNEAGRVVVDLAPDGRLMWRWLGAVTPKEMADNMANMGLNPEHWWQQLGALGYVNAASLGFSFSWWNHDDAPSYRALGPAKAYLENSAAGHRFVVGQPITPSPALFAISQGLLMASAATLARLQQGDTTSLPDIGVLTLLGALDPSFAHAALTRDGNILGFDAVEKTIFPTVLGGMEELARRAPQGVFLERRESARLLREVFGFDMDWSELLRAAAPLSSQVQTESGVQGSQRVHSFFAPLMSGALAQGLAREGESFVVNYQYDSAAGQSYAAVTDNNAALARGELPAAQFFVQAQNAIFAALQPYLAQAPLWSVIHQSEESKIIRRPRVGEKVSLSLRVEKTSGDPDRQNIISEAERESCL